MTAEAEYLVVISEPDPVARGVVERLPVGNSIGEFVEGIPIRELSERAWLLRRPVAHIHDEHLEALLPSALQARRIPLVFPSIHQSDSGMPCFTVHPLGNPTGSAEVGGRPRTLVPTDPHRMASALRLLAEAGEGIGLGATFEATHHGPELTHPAFFMEIGYGDLAGPPDEAVEKLARLLPEIPIDQKDRVAVALGGGHYAPHFTELVLERRWAIGHILSRHAIDQVDEAVARAAWTGTPEAVGWLCSRAADYSTGPWSRVGPRMRDNEAPRRNGPMGAGA